ncbi:autotransporter outer membrane beta-barrel domain-containing protein [Neisseria sp. Ec49-e6-T10]|uniref:autotransporter family protein n=1 Tax=Neisseria sp. Ec49-e6-T10 TaxID=3140744 RepID=UPI003EBED47C
MKKIPTTKLSIITLLLAPYTHAVCGYTSASAGSDCMVAGDNYYSKVTAQDSNSKLTFTGMDVFLQNGTQTVVSITNSGRVQFNDNVTINGSITAANRANNTVEILAGHMDVQGNLIVQSQMTNTSNNMLVANGNLTVQGDAHFEVLSGSTTGRALNITGNSQVKVEGSTSIVNHVQNQTTSTLVIVDTAKAQFADLFIISKYKESITASNNATLISTGQTIVDADSEGSSGIWFYNNALISLGEDIAVTRLLDANRAGIGQINIGDKATVKGARAISINSSDSETHITIKGVLDSMSNADFYGNQAIYGNSGKEVVIVEGNGKIYGHIDLRGGNDEVYLRSGVMETPDTDGGVGLGIDMGSGNDVFQATGGILKTPIVKMGTGQDRALLASNVNISQLAQIDGGADGTANNTGQLSIHDLSFNGYTNDVVQAGKGLDVTNWNTINLTGSAALALSDTQLFSTNTATTNPNILNIGAGSLLQTTDQLAVSNQNIWADVNNEGSINLSNNKTLNDVWTINGHYNGQNGFLIMDTALNADDSLTDKLIITGDTTGTTKVSVNNIGGLGAQTVQGIEVIEVQGVSDGEFVQNGRIVAGAYDYSLGRGSEINGTDDKNWYLTSYLTPFDPEPMIRPESGSYLSLIENQGAFNHSFHDRQQMLDNQYETAWARLEYLHTKSKSEGHVDNKNDRALIHLGSDIYQDEQFHLGIMGGYVNSDIRSNSRLTGNNAKSKSDGYSLGLYGTWYDQTMNQGGLYVDAYAQYNWFDNEVKGQGIRHSEKFSSNGYTLSVEAGYGFILGQTEDTYWQLEPQLQFIYNNFKGKNHNEKDGTRVHMSDENNVVSRVGVRIQGKKQGFQPFVTFNYWHHSDQAHIMMNEIRLHSDKVKNLYEIKTGGQIAINEKLTAYGQIEGALGSKSTKQYGANIGIKYNW